MTTTGMTIVSVKKQDVIDTLKKNRDEHKAIYTEADENYRQKVIDALRERADKIERGETINTYFALPEPEDHTDDYDEALETLKWEQREDLELSRNGEFQQWMLNKWHWDRAFAANTTSYTVGAVR